MSFNFEWPTFSEGFHADAREMLAQALNKGEKPPIIADRIEVKELNMGTIPPELEILEIGDLSTDRFRGIFRLTYSGDAHITLQTKVQANPLNVPRPSLDILDSPRILFAAAPLVVPMTLQLSSLSLRAIVVLVVSRQKGITLVFKNDPLESVDVSSSFDGVEAVAGFIQKEIEQQLREAFRSDLPGVIHRLSQKWLSGEVKSAAEGEVNGKAKGAAKGGFDRDAKIETRTAYVPERGLGENGYGLRSRGRGVTTRMDREDDDGFSMGGDSVTLASDLGGTSIAGGSHYVNDRSSARGSGGSQRPQRRYSSTSSQFNRPAVLMREDTLQSVPESIESYDPTYGLRPDALPLHLGFTEYERLVRTGATGRGLGDVLESSSEDEGERYGHLDADGSFDMVDYRDLLEDGYSPPVPKWDHRQRATSPSGMSQPRSRYSFDGLAPFPSDEDQADTSLETIPAVGGGTITRPRVFHTQSQMRTRTVSNGSLSAHGSPSTSGTTVRGIAMDEDDEASRTSTMMSPTLGIGRARLNGTPAEFKTLASLDGRQDYFAAPTHARYQSFSSAAGSGPGLLSRSMSKRAIGGVGKSPLQRSAFSSSNSTSPDTLRRSNSSSLFPPSALASSYSSPPSSIAHGEQIREEPDEDEDGVEIAVYPPPRLDPIDLLSRSPSSILNSMEGRDDPGPITLSVTANEGCAHLASLTHSNQTLSPFTRSHEHFAARSSPHVVNRMAGMASPGLSGLRTPGFGAKPGAGALAAWGGHDAQDEPVKATRKRIHRIGSAKPPASVASTPMHSPPDLGAYTSPRRQGMGERSSSGGGQSRGGAGGGFGGDGMSELSDYFPNTLLQRARMETARKRMSAPGVMGTVGGGPG